MSRVLSVIIPTHNPRPVYLARVIASLRGQTLSPDSWELVVVDNGSSSTELFASLDLAWHPRARILREERLGLTPARLAGVDATRGDVIVFVDDDNVLAPRYLETVASIFASTPRCGAVGGKALPEFDHEPPGWFNDIGIDLGCRDLGDEQLVASWTSASGADRRYPAFAPIGAGMAVRRQAIAPYVDAVRKDPSRLALDRRGRSLSSGGDNDIVMTVLSNGWEVAYDPRLQLTHLIPEERVSLEYLERMAHDSFVTWIAVLDAHGIRPWPRISRWTVPLREARAFWRLRPWTSIRSRIRWASARGQFQAQAALAPLRRPA